MNDESQLHNGLLLGFNNVFRQGTTYQFLVFFLEVGSLHDFVTLVQPDYPAHHVLQFLQSHLSRRYLLRATGYWLSKKTRNLSLDLLEH